MHKNKDEWRLPSVEHECVLCGARFIGWGHNPEPLAGYAYGLACDSCNRERVIPARMRRFYQDGARRGSN